MKHKISHITIFEHESLRTNRGEQRLTTYQLEALQLYYGVQGVPYYSLIHNGVKFSEYVGVIQVGNTTIEILPKADKNEDFETWREVLIGMLQAVGVFNIHAPSYSNLNLRSNSVLDLYFELFVIELEHLLHKGLVKKYRKTEGNTTALKGSIQFSKHIKNNLVHQERFFVRFSTFDKEHKLHSILYKALKLLSHINNNVHLNSRLGALMLDFPESKDIKISESLFDRIQLDRKTEPYKNALEIARLILLNYHPDVSKGNNDVLALMFDMNLLWEQFVYLSLRKFKTNGTSVSPQNIKNFWKPISGYRSKMKPDIVINKEKENCIVLDTKWKNLNGRNPSPEDLRQMFVYMKYFKAQRVALIYPGNEPKIQSGSYYEELTGKVGEEECSIISVSMNRNIRVWQKEINDSIMKWSQINL